MAGAVEPEGSEAVSVLPALAARMGWTRLRVCRQMTDGNYTDGPFMTMIRDHDWKLVHFWMNRTGNCSICGLTRRR